jgi:hypothetical protein
VILGLLKFYVILSGEKPTEKQEISGEQKLDINIQVME